MAAPQLNISIDQNTYFSMLLTIKQTVIVDGKPVKQPIDITGYSFKGQMRASTADSVVAEFSFEILDQTSADTKGKVRAWLSQAQTMAIPVLKNRTGSASTGAKYAYDILCGPSGENPRKYLSGSATIRTTVTK